VTDSFAAGSSWDPSIENAPSDCLPYSGSDKNNIVAETISRTNPETSEAQTGISITYDSGEACIADGSPTTFTIKTWCDPDLAIDDTDYSPIV